MNNQIFYFFIILHISLFGWIIFFFLAVYLPYLVILGAIVFLLFHHEVLKSQNP